LRLARDGGRRRNGAKAPNPWERGTKEFFIMAYKNHIAEWQGFTVSEKHVAAIRAMLEADFKAAGGRGELPRVVATRNILKGEVSVDAAAFQAGNVEEADDETVNTARGWVSYIMAANPGPSREAAIATMKQQNAGVPDFVKLVARMLAATQDKPKPAPAPAPAPKAAPAPAPAMHSVKPVKGKRAA
jgi:hypothetical protein